MAAYDLIVIGAGPAGASAALAASRAGMRTVLVDEAEAAGGQVYRAPPRGGGRIKARRSADEQAGADLRATLAASSVETRFGQRVWMITPGFRVDVCGAQGADFVTAPRLIAATGAHERVTPFPGWTHPGVIGLAAATILLKSQGMLPGRRTVVAGCGPLLAAVAAKIIEGGGEVAALVDLASRTDWLARLPALASRPALLRQGASWALKIGRSRTPLYFRHAIASAEGEDGVRAVTIRPVDAEGRPVPGPTHRIDCDALAVGHGLVPGSEIPKLLRAEHLFDHAARVWRPKLNADGRTSIEGLYACGDGAGVAGALPSTLAGARSGLAAALGAGALRREAFDAAIDGLAREQASAARFSDAMNHMMRPRTGLIDAIEPDTIVCRCEDVRRAEIEAAIRSGAREMNQLKHFTRCGMGPCQGRMCGETVAEILGAHVGREQAGYWTGRPPLRPVPISAVLGDFAYSDIPVPTPAPL
jgi:thioredoxin reductase/bacterioferritin-associated ferredoxin